MTVRFDSDGSTLVLSVADLLDAAAARHLGFSQRGGYERMWLGQAIHGAYQGDAVESDPTYRTEVPLSATLLHGDWEVTIQGRADGLRREEDGRVVVEEIKSIRGGTVAPATMEIYERQAAIYAWMLEQVGEERVGAELVLITIGTNEIERVPLDLDLEAVGKAVQSRVSALLATRTRERKALDARRTAAAELPFPHSEPRPGQLEIVEAVDEALTAGGHLFVEAPTGLGKTVAALYPALRYALAHDKRLFVLTAKTLQQELATAVLDLLNGDSAFRTLRIRAKSKMCANDEILCHEEYCPYARDYYGKLESSQVVPRILGEESTLLPDHIFARAKEAEVCPFEVSLELAGRSQVVVCDYNYAFDPWVALTDFSEGDLSDVVLVIDEIHNLVDRGRGYYSPHLSSSACRAVADAVSGNRDPMHRQLADLCLRLAAWIEDVTESALEDFSGDANAAETRFPEDDLWALRTEFDRAFVEYLEHRREARKFRAEDPFVGQYFDLLRFLSCLLLSNDDAFGHVVERRRDGAVASILCKDASRFLGERIQRCHGVIGLSATLSPVEFYRDLLGFDPERTSSISLPSPFPAENRRIVIDSTIETTYRRRPENYPRIAERLAEFAGRVPGNTLALFPSYRFLAEIAERVEIPGKQVLVQSPTARDDEREAILERLRSPLAGDAVLLAVAGGVFAEGVDYPGEMLRAVVIVGPSLPAVSLERELLKQYYEERFERGFEYAFVVPGMTRVVQAAGRLIRSADDTGVIALFDGRFLRPPYRGHLPGEWHQERGPESLVGSPAEAADDFFRRMIAPSDLGSGIH